MAPPVVLGLELTDTPPTELEADIVPGYVIAHHVLRVKEARGAVSIKTLIDGPNGRRVLKRIDVVTNPAGIAIVRELGQTVEIAPKSADGGQALVRVVRAMVTNLGGLFELVDTGDRWADWIKALGRWRRHGPPRPRTRGNFAPVPAFPAGQITGTPYLLTLAKGSIRPIRNPTTPP